MLYHGSGGCERWDVNGWRCVQIDRSEMVGWILLGVKKVSVGGGGGGGAGRAWYEVTREN